MLYKEAKLKKEVELQDHQKRLQKKLEKTDALLAYHSLGSGKTLSSIAATEGMKDRTVIVPASLRPNFKKELKAHTDQETPTKVLSYEQATKDLPQSDALIMDEAHRLSNANSLRSQAIRDKAKGFKKRILLTATPIRNHPADLAPLIHVLNPKSDVPLDPKEFNRRFIAEEKVKPGIIDRLLFRMSPGVVQRAKNVGDLKSALKGKVDYYDAGQTNFPSSKERIVRVPMSDEQRQIFETVSNRANPYIARKIRSNFPLSKSESGNLAAFLTGPRIASTSTTPYGGREVTPKLKRVLSDIKGMVEGNPRHKSVIYSNYLEGGVNDLAKLLEQEKIPHRVFSGSLNDEERAQIVRDYNEDKIKALLLTDAGAEGLDLKGTRAVHLLNPSWNLPKTDQVEGRAIRFGSHAALPEAERNVDIIRYHSVMPRKWHQKLLGRKPDTAVDDYLYNLANKKERLNRQFLDVLRDVGSEKPQEP